MIMGIRILRVVLELKRVTIASPGSDAGTTAASYITSDREGSLKFAFAVFAASGQQGQLDNSRICQQAERVLCWRSQLLRKLRPVRSILSWIRSVELHVEITRTYRVKSCAATMYPAAVQLSTCGVVRTCVKIRTSLVVKAHD